MTSTPNPELPEACWNIELNIDCPHCGEYINALDTPDFWDGRKFDIGEHKTERTSNLTANCTECHKDFSFDIGDF